MSADGARQMLERRNLDGYTALADKGVAGDEFEQLTANLDAHFLRTDHRDEPSASARSARCAQTPR